MVAVKIWGLSPNLGVIPQIKVINLIRGWWDDGLVGLWTDGLMTLWAGRLMG